MNKISSYGSGQEGVVLIEALLAVMIFSLSILGLVGMLGLSSSTLSEAQYRSEAALWVDSFIAEMRVANPDTRSGDYSSPGGVRYQAWLEKISSCTDDEVACKILPGADVFPPEVTFDGDMVTVSVFWKKKSADDLTRKYTSISVLEPLP